jgi:cation diffusion facilitator CzcD-associated flavoprotein CzcO
VAAGGGSPVTGTAVRPLRFVVIGAGMAGILAAIELHRAGFDDLVVYEKADRLGGTWRENTYPGIACDVPSHLYRYSFAPNPNWTRAFSPGDEIHRYLEDVAREHGVLDDIRFCTEITSMEWREGRWHMGTHEGPLEVADVVIAATGVLHHPRYPDVPGLDAFDGACFHSARWDHDVVVEGARVGVVGTGSTAVQITSALVDVVGEYHLFQRTPQWVLPMQNPEIPSEDRERYRHHPELMEELRRDLAAAFEASFADVVIDADAPQLGVAQQLCEDNLACVKDPRLREALRPDYRAMCKRLVVSPDFYQAVQRPNAHLVTAPIECVEAGGVRTADGVLHELDVLVLATGFRVDRFLRPIDVVGRGGVHLDEVWAERPTAYLSISIPDFPNLFMLNGPNGPVGNFSLIDVAELQFAYILQLVDELASGRTREVCASREATERFEAERVEAAQHTIWVTGCRSWYLDDRGVPAAWPFTMGRFREEMAAPKLEDYQLD